MKLTVPVPKPRQPRKKIAPSPRLIDDPNWMFSFQPPSEAEWQEFLSNAQPAALAGVISSRNVN
jgi:hypothetical protein